MHQPRARDMVAQEAGDAFLSPLVSRRAHLTTGRAGSFIFFHRNVWQRGLRFAPVLYDRTSYVRCRERRVAYIRQNQGCFRGRGYGGYHVREERYMGRSSMGVYKILAGEERQMRGAPPEQRDASLVQGSRFAREVALRLRGWHRLRRD